MLLKDNKKIYVLNNMAIAKMIVDIIDDCDHHPISIGGS